ncbi:MAG: DciA family protein [Acidobacteriota bacterium]|nr:DciA family protein [Acidobacteriota bacterium]
MQRVPPPSDRRPKGPAPIGDLLGLVFPSREQGALLDIEFLRALWDRAAPADIARKAVPVRVERRVLTIVTADPRTRAEAHGRRTEIARRLVSAAGLPKARLRVRVELGVPELAEDASGRGRRVE